MDIKTFPRKRKTLYYIHIPVEQVVSGSVLQIWDPPQHFDINLYDAFDITVTSPIISPRQVPFNTWLRSKIIEVINQGVPIVLETPNKLVGDDIIIASVAFGQKTIIRPRNLAALTSKTRKKFMTRVFDFFYIEPDLQISNGDLETVDGDEETVQNMLVACMETAYLVQKSGERSPATIYRILIRKLSDLGVLAEVRITDDLRVMIDLPIGTRFTGTMNAFEPTPLLFHTEVRT